jgi:hypothetical protein
LPLSTILQIGFWKSSDWATPDDARQDIFHDQSSGSLSYLKKKIKTNSINWYK